MIFNSEIMAAPMNWVTVALMWLIAAMLFKVLAIPFAFPAADNS